jgi:hypothetical protein
MIVVRAASLGQCIDLRPLAAWATFARVSKVQIWVSGGGRRVIQAVARAFGIFGIFGILAVVIVATSVLGEDDFPIVGTYTENQPCAGADAAVSRVKITKEDIDSVFGLCSILQRKREGNTYAVHVQCKGPGGSEMLGDINFTLREDKTIDFADQDQTYKAVLYKCPN